MYSTKYILLPLLWYLNADGFKGALTSKDNYETNYHLPIINRLTSDCSDLSKNGRENLLCKAFEGDDE